MARTWTCRCGQKWAGTKKKCTCGVRRPVRKKPAHQLVLEIPYEVWVARYGERCGICGRPPSAQRNLDRDHDHRTGEARGLLCHQCNRGLRDWVTAEWLDKAAAYLRKANGAPLYQGPAQVVPKTSSETPTG
jgi:hypothetical protein